MKTFYSLEDIERLAAQGVRELVVDEDTILTDVARDAASQLGLQLVSRGRVAAEYAGNALAPGATISSGGKPRGCQHGPLTASAPAPAAARASGTSERLIDDLVGAVKQLANKGSTS